MSKQSSVFNKVDSSWSGWRSHQSQSVKWAGTVPGSRCRTELLVSPCRLSGLGESAELEASCASGCNPHCHFLLLLRSISFDHSILLDFLISTETCFLEYFVRYLKYLRADWQGFTAACGKVSVSDCQRSLQKSLPDSGAGDMFTLTYKGQPEQVGLSPCGQPKDAPIEMISVAAGSRLVEYSSSDESGPENMDCQDEPGTSACENGRFSALDGKRKISGAPITKQQYEPSHPPVLPSPSNSALERTPEGSSSLTERMSCPDVAPLSGQVTCETSVRAVLCLSQLREVVTRLQTKNLFPYNPSSLIKLLQQVQNCFQQSHPSQFDEWSRHTVFWVWVCFFCFVRRHGSWI